MLRERDLTGNLMESQPTLSSFDRMISSPFYLIDLAILRDFYFVLKPKPLKFYFFVIFCTNHLAKSLLESTVHFCLLETGLTFEYVANCKKGMSRFRGRNQMRVFF